ncbi:MAG: VWA domain-containing protein [Deltaproteobacteria bacterium]|nr:VWA domain-containing protein [Deltaproteobacteria bacterium]MBW2418434.1 VWA domain-containing protein [Deltaproteobacteria bacterium]
MILRSAVAWGVIGALLVAGAASCSDARAAGESGSRIGRIYLDDVLPAPDGQRAVELLLRAETAYGEAVAGLRSGDLEVRDNGDRISAQRIALTLLSETHHGTACVIAIDASRTMKGEPFARALEAALGYLEQMGEQDRLAVLTFADRVEVVFSFDVARDEARRRLETLSEDEDSLSTLLFDGLFRSVALLREAPELPRRRFTIAFSNGQDQGSRRSLAEVIEQAQGSDAEPRVPVYAVGYARFGGSGLENLERLAQDTTGRAFEASSTSQLPSIFEVIRQRMLRGYVLRFPARMDGERHTIDVSFKGMQDTRGGRYPDLREPSWPLALSAAMLVVAGVMALLYQRRRKRRAATRPAKPQLRNAGGTGAKPTPALPKDRVIMP